MARQMQGGVERGDAKRVRGFGELCWKLVETVETGNSCVGKVRPEFT